MSKAHNINLPVIARHVTTIWSSVHIEAQLNRHGEKMDIFGRAERPVNTTMAGVDIELWAGMTSVHEYKDNVPDLRADADKPWRRNRDEQGRILRAFGDHRFLWFHRHGGVRPEHVEEERHPGWGIVVFDEIKFQIVKASERFPVAFYDTIELVAQLKDQAAARQRIEIMNSTVAVQGLANRTRDIKQSVGAAPAPGSAPGSSSGGGAPVGASPIADAYRRVSGGGRVDPLDLVDEYLRVGPATTSQLCRHLLEEHGIKLTPLKLKERMMVSGRYVKPSTAGNWTLKNRGAA